MALRSGDRTLAYLWSAACHPTGLADGDKISAHWPGVVRETLRGRGTLQHPGASNLPVLFFQGFSGDVRPPSGGTKTGFAAATLQRLRLGPTFAPLDAMEYAEWSQSVADHIARIAAQCTPHTESLALSCARIELPASRFALGADSLPPVSFQRVTVGDITFVGVSAEPVSGYARQLRSLMPGKQVIPVGCIDHVIGYWPTAGDVPRGWVRGSSPLPELWNHSLSTRH